AQGLPEGTEGEGKGPCAKAPGTLKGKGTGEFDHPCGRDCIRHALVSLEELAVHTRLPFKWLARLAREGKLPALPAGNRLLFVLEHVEERILQMARKNKFGEYP